MRLTAMLLTLALCGCGSLNSPREPNAACTDKPHACGCISKELPMDGCAKNADGSTCCKPNECRCKEVTSR